jgi:hypothetical protein
MKGQLYVPLALWSLSALANVVPDSVVPPEPPAPCSHPAPLQGIYDASAPHITIAFEPNVDPGRAARDLSTKYSLKVDGVLTAGVKGFIVTMAPLDSAVIGRLRCESEVQAISFAVPTSTTGIEATARAPNQRLERP